MDTMFISFFATVSSSSPNVYESKIKHTIQYILYTHKHSKNCTLVIAFVSKYLLRRRRRRLFSWLIRVCHPTSRTFFILSRRRCRNTKTKKKKLTLLHNIIQPHCRHCSTTYCSEPDASGVYHYCIIRARIIVSCSVYNIVSHSFFLFPAQFHWPNTRCT